MSELNMSITYWDELVEYCNSVTLFMWVHSVSRLALINGKIETDVLLYIIMFKIRYVIFHLFDN